MRTVPFLPESRVTGMLRRMHRPEVEDVTTVLRSGEKMVVPLREVSGFHIYIRGQHQPYVLKHLREHIKPGMTVFDVGACLGLVTVTTASLVGPNGRVHSFEPGTRQIKYLRQNVAINGFEERVKINECAVSDVNGEVVYVEGKSFNMGGSYVGEDGQGEKLRSTSLDTYMEVNGIARVDCVKFDVEGCEMRALNGFRKAMDGSTPPSLILYECRASTCERQGHTPGDLHGFFLDRGYSVTKARGGRITRSNANAFQWQNDFVALRRS